TVNGDGVSEPSETFNVVLGNLQGNATVTNGTGIGTIVDDDAQPAITINDVSVLEGDSGETNAIFTVNLTTASQAPVTVDYTTQNGSA
ncbi:hypothetical protein, partial [Leptolyngbya sp. CCY15150]|uniref:hypothetical protein n=1 Tax=Leptolyngbya sp. CCY15150 TaxID=2767772 RepID=UPI00195237E0